MTHLTTAEVADIAATVPPVSQQDQGYRKRSKAIPYHDKARRKAALYPKLEAYVDGVVATLQPGQRLDSNTRAIAQMIGIDLGDVADNSNARKTRSAYATGNNAKHRGRGVEADRQRAEEALGLVDDELAGELEAQPRAKRAAHVSGDADTPNPTSAGVPEGDAPSDPIPR